ncbi:MAG: hypothetical protein ACQERU_09565, partial [Bacteroidota bacterium]
MKNNVFTSVLAMLITFSTTVYSQKTVEKTFPVSADDDISLEFKFADDIKVSTWDKKEVYVKVSVNINDNSNNDHFELNFNQRSTG